MLLPFRFMVKFRIRLKVYKKITLGVYMNYASPVKRHNKATL